MVEEASRERDRSGDATSGGGSAPCETALRPQDVTLIRRYFDSLTNSRGFLYQMTDARYMIILSVRWRSASSFS